MTEQDGLPPRAQVEALMRLLIGSGDATPTAARMMGKLLDEVEGVDRLLEDARAVGESDLPRHEPLVARRRKMDADRNDEWLWAGACSCGWRSEGIRSPQGAWRDAVQHMDAKNVTEMGA